jgi:glutathione peroxidase-family protein
MIFCFLFLFFKYASALDDIYGIRFMGLDSNEIKLNQFAGKQIIVFAFDASNPEIKLMKSLDSIYRNSNGGIVIIGIPVNDIDINPAYSNTSLLSLIRDSLNISYPIAQVSHGKRGINQHPLMRWITTTSRKNHFNIDLDNSSEIFAVSSDGVLYGVLQNGMPSDKKIINYILNNEARE